MWRLVEVQAELFESQHEAAYMRVELKRLSEVHDASLKMGCWAPRSPTTIFDHGFECCEIILHSHYPEIGLAIESLVLVNAFLEMVRIMRARGVSLIEALDSSYLYLPEQ